MYMYCKFLLVLYENLQINFRVFHLDKSSHTSKILAKNEDKFSCSTCLNIISPWYMYFQNSKPNLICYYLPVELQFFLIWTQCATITIYSCWIFEECPLFNCFSTRLCSLEQSSSLLRVGIFIGASEITSRNTKWVLWRSSTCQS